MRLARGAESRKAVEKPLLTEPGSGVGHVDVSQLIATLAVESWRMRRKLERLGSELSDDQLAGLRHSLDLIGSELRNYTVECRDHTGEPYDAGMALKPLDFERTAGLPPGKQEIVRTVAPSVYICGHLVREGEVVVGVCPDEGVDQQ